MSRVPMTPERFQSRDVKRRLTKLESQMVYREASLVRLAARVKAIEQKFLHFEAALGLDPHDGVQTSGDRA